MEWFNVFGLVFMIIIMIPNIVFAIKKGRETEHKWKNKAVEIIEQTGRVGCFAFMIFNIPGTGFGFSSGEAFAAYLIIDAVLVLSYCALWIILRKKRNTFRALALSVVPSLIFLLSGILSHSLPLTISALVFAPSHILVSYKDSK